MTSLIRFKAFSVRARIGFACFCIIWCGMALFLIAMPKFCDDYRFLSPFADWMARNGGASPDSGISFPADSFPLDSLKYIWKWHWLNDNARLCNILAVPLLWLPKWLVSSAVAILWGGAMWCVLRLASLDWRKVEIVAVAMACFSFGLPWSDTMGSVVFQLNYVAASGLAALYFLWIVSGRIWRSGRLTVLVLSFLMGAWQEAFSIPLFVGVGWLAIGAGRKRRCLLAVALAGLALGIAWIAAAPPVRNAFAGRFATAAGSNLFSSILLSLCDHPLFLLAIALTVVRIIFFKRAWRPRTGGRMGAVSIMAAVSFILAFSLNGGARAGWWCDLMSVVCIVSQLGRFGMALRWRRISAVAAALLMLLASTEWLATDMLALAYRSDLHRAVSLAKLNPEEAVPMRWLYSSPWARLAPGMPDQSLYGYPITGMREYYGYADDSPFLSMVPLEMADASESVATRIPGSAGVLEWKGHLFMPALHNGNRVPHSKLAFNMRFDYSYPASGGCNLASSPPYIPWIEFTSQADGRRYLLIVPPEKRRVFPFTSFPLPSRVDFISPL